jgi:hypothetical protein
MQEPKTRISLYPVTICAKATISVLQLTTILPQTSNYHEHYIDGLPGKTS